MKKYLYIEINHYDPFEYDQINWKYAIKGSYGKIPVLSPVSDYTIGQNEKIYFMPGTNVPRVKLKDIFAQTKSKTTRNIDEATKIIVGNKTADAISDTIWYYEIETEAFKKVINYVYNNEGKLETRHYDNIMELLSIYTEEIVICDYRFARYVKLHTPFKEILQEGKISSGSEYYTEIKDNYTETYENILQSKSVFCCEQTLIGLVNGDDSTTIDNAMYESLDEMFQSRDTDNVVVAMEIMANSNYQESLYYLCLLFEAHYNKISDQRSRNHVNFKSLCNYMGFSSPSYCSMSKDDIVNLLIEKQVFNSIMALDLLKRYSAEVKGRGESECFKITKITLKTEALNYLANSQVNQNEPVTDSQ